MNFVFSEEFDLEGNPISNSAKRKGDGGRQSHHKNGFREHISCKNYVFFVVMILTAS